MRLRAMLQANAEFVRTWASLLEVLWHCAHLERAIPLGQESQAHYPVVAEQRYQFIAPLFYLSGVTLCFGSVVTGAFAVVAGWMLGGASRNLSSVLPAMGIALLGAGYIFGITLSLIFNVVLLLLPFAPAFVFRKRMVHVGASAY